MSVLDWLRKPTATTVLPLGAEKRSVTMQLKNIWQRKVVEFPNAETMAKADILARKSAFKIVNDPVLSSQYVEIYGQDEFNTLKAGLEIGKDNLVQSYVEARCPGGTFVPSEVKPQTPLGPDEVWLDPPFCTRRGKRADIPVLSPTNPGSMALMSKAELRQMILDCVEEAFEQYAHTP